MAWDSRRDLIVQKGKVANALPEHFARDYPNLVAFLDAYYEFMRDNSTHGFDTTIENLVKAHDTLGSDVAYLDYLMRDLTNGTDYSTTLTDARIKAQLFADFYRTKGSLYSIEKFFRWLYGEDVTVEYGKQSVFIVSESKIGPLSLKYIKNDKLYQTFALLIKVGVPVSTWRDAYKKFVHPAGFYFEGQVAIESVVDLNLGAMTEVVLDSDANVLSVSGGVGSVSITPFTSITGLYPDDSDADGDQQRVEFSTKISDLDSSTLSALEARYDDINDLIDPNSPTFDDSGDGILMSSGIERMDQDVFDLNVIDPVDNEPLLADSDIDQATMDNIIYTLDNAVLTMDRTI